MEMTTPSSNEVFNLHLKMEWEVNMVRDHIHLQDQKNNSVSGLKCPYCDNVVSFAIGMERHIHFLKMRFLKPQEGIHFSKSLMVMEN